MLYKWITFTPRQGECGGSLIQFQSGKSPGDLPFEIKKVLFISDISPSDIRGSHAHHATTEVIVCLQGGCVIDLDDGGNHQETLDLSKGNRGILLYPRVWRVLRDFRKGTLLLILANRTYAESDYIRDRDEFLRSQR